VNKYFYSRNGLQKKTFNLKIILNEKQRPKLDFLRFRFTKCSKFHFLEKKDLRRILPVETHSFNHFVKTREAESRSSPSAGWKRNSIFGWKDELEFSLGLNGVCWVEDSSGP